MDYIKSIRPKLGHQKIILNAANALIVKEDKILLQRRSDNGQWCLPGGILELNETYEEGAIREAKEETGLDIKIESFLGIFHNHHMRWPNGDEAHVVGAFFLASIIGGALTLDEESLELRFFDVNELPPLFAVDHENAIEAYLKGVRLALPKENQIDEQ